MGSVSDFSTICDAIIADLTANVSGLSSVETHRYTPWSPEQLDAADGDRHLAVWPIGEQMGATEEATAETAGGLGGTHRFTQSYVVLVWEKAAEEASRRKEFEAEGETFLELHNAIRARIYVSTFQTLGGASPLWYVGTQLPSEPAGVRWMAITLRATRYQDFTP